LHIFQALNILKQGIFSMTGIKIDGKEIAKSVKERVKKAVEELKAQNLPPLSEPSTKHARRLALLPKTTNLHQRLPKLSSMKQLII
jgi:hypothetical protein